MTGRHRNDIDLEKLKHEYVDLKMPTTVLAIQYGCSPETISNKLRSFGIVIRTTSESRILIGNYMGWRRGINSGIRIDNRKIQVDRQWLEDRYIKDKLSINQISKEIGCNDGTISSRLKEFGIPLRSRSDSAKLMRHDFGVLFKMREKRLAMNQGILNKFNISMDELYQKYIVEGRGMTDICKDYGCTHATIKNKLIQYDIKRRNSKESHNMTKYRSKLKLLNRRKDVGYDILPNNPQEGDKVHGYLFGKKRGIYIWHICGRCNVGRWVSLNNYKNSKTDGFCRGCFMWHEKTRKKRSDANLKRYKDVEERRKTGEYSHRVWERKAKNGEKDAYVRNILKGNSMKPTKPENEVIMILSDLYQNEWKYVGDGEVILGGKNPDIINVNGYKAIIEVNGTYWHSKKHRKECPFLHELQRIDHFKKFGYFTLVIWEHELKNKEQVINKIRDFYSEISKPHH